MGKRNLMVGAGLIAAIVALGYGQQLIEPAADAATAQAPMFEVDPLWPKPLPNHWLLGSAIGVGVDSRDHVFVIHRRQSFNTRTEIGAAMDPPTGDCCFAAPNILEFDPDGNLVNSWGGPGEGYEWPSSNHGLSVDPKDNIWIGGNGRSDSHILKFSRDGEFLAEYGEPGAEADSNSLTSFGDLRMGADYEAGHDKILVHEDSYLGIVGSAAHQLVMESIFKQDEIKVDFSSRLTVFETFRLLHPVLKDKYFLNAKDEDDDPYESTQIDLQRHAHAPRHRLADSVQCHTRCVCCRRHHRILGHPNGIWPADLCGQTQHCQARRRSIDRHLDEPTRHQQPV